MGQPQVPIWNIPYQRNPLFTGREDVLKKLSEALKVGKTAAISQPQAISGLGGIGKTQTAVEYAYRNQHNYQAILWVKAESESSINVDFITIVGLLDLSEKQVQQDQHKIIEAVKRWFQSHTDWLLILDNADDISMVQGFIPSGSKGHILLTTRAHATGQFARRIEVEKMEPDEGAIFLLHRAKLLDANTPLATAPRTEQDTAREIIKLMDGLPLALDQAGAYIEETECGLQGYWQLYQIQAVQLLKERGALVTDHPDPVATTWSLSFKSVEQAKLAATELLRFCAFLAPDSIPVELFTESATELGRILEQVSSNPSILNATVRELLKYSLIHRDAESNTLSIHRLVQEVLKDQVDEEIQRMWAERVVRAMSLVFPDPEYTNWYVCRRYLLHAQVCNSLIVQWDMTFPEAVLLLINAGGYLQQSFQYEEAELLWKGALAIRERMLGPYHLIMANSLYGLAGIYSNQGKYEQSESLYQHTLKIHEETLPPDNPYIADILENYAKLLQKMNRIEVAEQLEERARTIRTERST